MNTYWINYEMCDDFREQDLELQAPNDEVARIMYNDWKEGVEGLCTYSYLVDSDGELVED